MRREVTGLHKISESHSPSWLAQLMDLKKFTVRGHRAAGTTQAYGLPVIEGTLSNQKDQLRGG